jgi:hypothetical protein
MAVIPGLQTFHSWYFPGRNGKEHVITPLHILYRGRVALEMQDMDKVAKKPAGEGYIDEIRIYCKAHDRRFFAGNRPCSLPF